MEYDLSLNITHVSGATNSLQVNNVPSSNITLAGLDPLVFGVSSKTLTSNDNKLSIVNTESLVGVNNIELFEHITISSGGLTLSIISTITYSENFNETIQESNRTYYGVYPTTDDAFEDSMINATRSFASTSNYDPSTEASYFIMDMGEEKYLIGIRSQGRGDADQWTTAYKVQYSSDNTTYTTATPANPTTNGFFEGNTDRNTIVTSMLSEAVLARYVKYFQKRCLGTTQFVLMLLLLVLYQMILVH